MKRTIQPYSLVLIALLLGGAADHSVCFAEVQLEVSPDSLRLSGRVPSMAQRESLHRLLDGSKLLLDHLIVDRQETGHGLPVLTGVLQPVASALASGTLRVDDGKLTLEGSVPSNAARDELLRLVDPCRRSGLSLETSLNVVAPAPEPWIEVAFSPTGHTMSGLVALPETVQCLHPAGSNSLQVSQELLRSTWETELAPHLAGLLDALSKQITQGTLHLAPGHVTLHGTVSGVEQKLRATRLAKTMLPGSFRVENFLRSDAQSAPSPEIVYIPQPAAVTPPASLDSPTPSIAIPAAPASPAFPTPASTQVTPTAEAPARTLSFKSGSAWISPTHRTVLKDVIASFQKLPASARVLIRSLQDSRGDPEVSRNLSRERASAVQRALVLGGVSNTRIELEFPPRTPGASAADRKVELFLLP